MDCIIIEDNLGPGLYMSPSRQLPVLRTAMLCELITVDREQRPYSLIMPVHTLRWPHDHKGGYQPPTLELYLQFAEVSGECFVRAALKSFGQDHDLYRTPSVVRLEFPADADPVIPHDYSLILNGMAFPEPGAYDLVIYANHVALNDPFDANSCSTATIPITVLPADGSEGGVI
jgi:hypothetical protein